MIRHMPGWLTMAAIVLLTGCSIFPSKSTRFYVLDPLEAQTSTSGIQTEHELSVKVFYVRLPQYLDRPQIVTRNDSSRMTLAEYHQWGGNLRKNITRVLGQNLSTLLQTPRIQIAPHIGSTRSDVRVEVEIMKFERGTDKRVHLQAQWRLLDGESSEVRTARLTTLSSAGTLADGDYDGIVDAMSKLFGELSGLIATEISKHYPGA